MGENIKVAVRVRPFNDREKKKGVKLVVNMEGNTTILVDPENPKVEPRKFTYDHSYWSHDGYRVDDKGYCEPTTRKYVDQMKVFTELGLGMLGNAWDGYNCSLFAYGQTGSGKSYSIMGHGANKGLVPRVCERLFLDIGEREQPGVTYEVTFSMLEIYNEQVRDLLNKKKTPPGGLKIKERPGRGFFVDGLSVVPVGSYSEIQLRMKDGDRNRTIAATKMNETSSRAHTIVTLGFAQNTIKTKTTKYSSINLVDLAGSERAKQTEATGDRFTEAKNINKSLLTLGNVIKGLCDVAKGKKSVAVPYRDSILTKLLKNALGGNSKTVMIAALGPDSENYEQTLSTLKYADRAKSIKTSAQVNQTATDKMIKELIAEKERLLRELQSAKSGTQVGLSEDEIQRMKEEQESEIRRYKEQMQDIEKSWQRRLEEARAEMKEMMEREKKAEEEEKRIPHLSNLNEDPALNGKIIHITRPGTSKVGNGKDDTIPEIRLNGPRIAKEHAIITSSKDGKLTLKPKQGIVLHNGEELTKDINLQHNDRIRFGSNNLFVFIHPGELDNLKKKKKHVQDITYEYAQNEIAKHSGLNLEDEDAILQEEVMSIMQLVQDVNAMSEDMDKQTEFSIVLVSAEARGLDVGRTEVFVCMHDLNNGNEYLWERNKFLVRQTHMQDMYRQFEEGGLISKVKPEEDPFWEPYDTEGIVGVVSVPLKFLSHLLDFQDEPLTVIDYRAKQCGFLRVDLLPCDKKGREDVDLCVNDPTDLVNHTISFKIKTHQAMNLPEKYKTTWCRYRFYNDSDYVYTDRIDGPNPKYNHVYQFTFNRNQVDMNFVDYLRDRSLAIEIWGQQGDRPISSSSSASTNRGRKGEKARLQEEVDTWKDKASALEAKIEKIKAVVATNPKSFELKKIQKIIDEK